MNKDAAEMLQNTVMQLKQLMYFLSMAGDYKNIKAIFETF
jgi:hypothetical protein